MLHFAYGSNLDWAQMRGRCPSARFIAVARLDDHRFAITRYSKKRRCGVADVVTSAGQVVWGVVYSVGEEDVPTLDCCEGAPFSYRRVQRFVTALASTERLTVQLYVANPQHGAPPPPNQAYRSLIVNGARFWGLPAEYIQELENIVVA